MKRKKRIGTWATVLILSLMLGGAVISDAQVMIGPCNFNFSFSSTQNYQYSENSGMRVDDYSALVNGNSVGGDWSEVRVRIIHNTYGTDVNVSNIYAAQLGQLVIPTYNAFANSTLAWNLKGWSNYQEAYFTGWWWP